MAKLIFSMPTSLDRYTEDARGDGGRGTPDEELHTFFRSLGAVLGYRPPAGSLAGAKHQRNYRFSPQDTAAIIAWIDAHLRVRWLTLPKVAAEPYGPQLIAQLRPPLNLKGNPDGLPALRAARKECQGIAAGSLPPRLSP